MDWQEFVEIEARKHGLSPDEEATLLAALPSENAHISQKTLAAQLQTTLPNVKKRLGKIYQKFGHNCPNLEPQKGAGKLKILRNYLTSKYYKPGHITSVNPTPELSYPPEFKALIEEKTRNFCGRQFVFHEFEKFMRENPCGYFTVVADAGMGKSAIAAKYVSDNFAPCYFIVLVERRNTPEQFLQNIRQQLIQRYALQNAEADDLPTLLAKVAEKLTETEQLAIVVDALDEVDQDPGDNLLHLPTTLPKGVYFLLTRRPYNLEKKRLVLSPEVPETQLDLSASEYEELNEADIKQYIRFVIEKDPEHGEALKQWMQQRQIPPPQFIDCVAEKSQNNFMYLRYVLPAIAKGQYDNLELTDLPEGLEGYYQQHWVRMKMETEPRELMTIVLFILVEISTQIPSEMMAGIAEKDEYEVQKVLDEWVEYLSKREIEGECCYSIYHTSFLDFLKQKRELKKTRKLFKKVNGQIAKYLVKKMA